MTPDLPKMDGFVRRQLHLFLLLDCSGSMSGDKIASLNFAVRSAIPAIQDVASEHVETDVYVRVCRFSSGASWHIQPTRVGELQWSELKADGPTDMGYALKMAASHLSPETLPGRQLPPVIVLVSDGQPTDDFAAGLQQLLDAPYGKKSIRIAIAIGSDADLDILQTFLGNKETKPLKANNASDLADRIKWATTVPLARVSEGRGGDIAASAPDESIGVMTW